MRICSCARADFAKESGSTNADPVRITCIWVLAHHEPCECEFEILIERKLNGDVGEAKKGRRETGVKCPYAFACIHLARSIQGILIIPRSVESVIGRP